MTERDAFELRLETAIHGYVERVSSDLDPAELAHRIAATEPRRVRAATLIWRGVEIPRVAWVLLLLAALLTAIVAGMLVVGAPREQKLPAVVPPVSPTASPPTTDRAAGAETYLAVSSAGDHTCALTTASTIECWGGNVYGQATPPEGTYVAVTTGAEHSCAIRTDGTLACWGNDYSDQATPPAGSYVALSAGWMHTCAIRTDGILECWGNIGEVAGPTPGTYRTVNNDCAIHTDGALTCWDPEVERPPPAGTYLAVSTVGGYACALGTDGGIECWGNRDHGQVTPPEGTYVAVSTGGEHTCAIRMDGTLTCWGNDWGSDYSHQTTPPAGTYVAVSASWMPDYEDCAIRTDGTLACWGSDWIAKTRKGSPYLGPPTMLIPAMGRTHRASAAPEMRRGSIEFGSGGSGCLVTAPSTTFAVGDAIRFAAGLQREVQAGEAVTIALSVDGDVQGEFVGRRDVVIEDAGTSRSFDAPGDCVGGLMYWAYAAPPGGDLSAFPISWTTGHYRLVLSAGGEVLSQGEFDVGP